MLLLIDLICWRQQRIEDRIYEVIKKHNKIFQGDQGVINTVFCGKAKELPLRYDVMTYLYDFSYDEMILYRKPDAYFGEEDVQKSVKNPAIVHFSSSFKSDRPWNFSVRCKHPFLDEWMYYYQVTGGKMWPGKKNDFKYNRFFLLLIGLLHAYIRPVKNLLF